MPDQQSFASRRVLIAIRFITKEIKERTIINTNKHQNKP